MSAAIARGLARCRAGLLGGVAMLAAASAAAMSCEGGPLDIRAGYRRASSDWFEFDSAGHQIVREAGVLQGAELTAVWDCGRGQFQAQVSQDEGTRMYEGQTSAGVPALSRSAVTLLQGHVQAGWHANDAWTLGARLSGLTMWRDIASTPVAWGYPERYDLTVLSLGALWQAAFDAGQVTLGLWHGSALQSTMRVTFPGYDPAMLHLGAVNQLELSAGWRMQLNTAWHVQADLRQMRTDMARSEEVVITRNGLPVGVAHQPQSRMSNTSLAILIGYQF